MLAFIHLHSMLLHTTKNAQLVKKWIDFNVEMKFHFEWEYWMALHAIWIEIKFQFNLIQINSRITIQLNWIQIQL
jgi:hypothetical protein